MPDNGKKTTLDFDSMPQEVKDYVAELRKEKRAADLKLKELSVELEQRRKSEADAQEASRVADEAKQKAALVASAAIPPDQDVVPPDVRKMTKDEYKAYRKSFNETMHRKHVEEREARHEAERIPHLEAPAPKEGEQQQVPSVRGMTKAEYKKVKEAFRRGIHR